MNDKPLEHPLPEPLSPLRGPELPDWNATEPPPKALRGDHYVLPGGTVMTPDDFGIDPDYTPVLTDSAFEVALDQLATELPLLVQKQDSGQEHSEPSHEELKEALREALREQQASGEAQPLSVEVARLANRVKTDATSVWADLEDKHHTWSARMAPALPTLNPDGSVATPATLTKAAGIGVTLFLFLLLVTTWKVALVWTWLVVAAYVLAPMWRPKLRAVLLDARRRMDEAGEPPQE